MKDDFMNQVLAAHKRSYRRAFETAVRTKTALIFEKDGKIIKERPPFRYELRPIKSTKKRKLSTQRHKK